MGKLWKRSWIVWRHGFEIAIMVQSVPSKYLHMRMITRTNTKSDTKSRHGITTASHQTPPCPPTSPACPHPSCGENDPEVRIENSFLYVCKVVVVMVVMKGVVAVMMAMVMIIVVMMVVVMVKEGDDR